MHHKRKRVNASLMPGQPSSAPPTPPFAERLAKLFDKKKLAISGARLIRAERDKGN